MSEANDRLQPAARPGEHGRRGRHGDP